MGNEDQSDSQPGRRRVDKPLDGSQSNGTSGTWDGLTGEQRALADVIVELAHTGERFRRLSERLSEASRDRSFAGEYIRIVETFPDLKVSLNNLELKLRDRALAAMKAKDSE